jgi:hypothetical protein
MTALRLAIVGDGKMGRAINDLARERAFVVTAMLGAADNANGSGVTRDRLGDADVVIEFTEPEAAPANIVLRSVPAIPSSPAPPGGPTASTPSRSRCVPRTAHSFTRRTSRSA